MTTKTLAPRLMIALIWAAGTMGLAQTPKSKTLDALTVADLNAAFDAGFLTSEQLVQLYLARIAAYDRKGPTLHALITVNPKAVELARQLDAERKVKGR